MERKLPSPRIVLHNVIDDEFSSLIQAVAALFTIALFILFSNYSQNGHPVRWIGQNSCKYGKFRRSKVSQGNLNDKTCKIKKKIYYNGCRWWEIKSMLPRDTYILADSYIHTYEQYLSHHVLYSTRNNSTSTLARGRWLPGNRLALFYLCVVQKAGNQ